MPDAPDDIMPIFSRKAVAECIETIVAANTQLGNVPIDWNTDLVHDAGLDSLGIIDILVDIEEALHLQSFDDEARERLKVGEIISHVTSILMKQGRLVDA